MSDKSAELLRTLPFPIDGYDIAILACLKRTVGSFEISEKYRYFSKLDAEVIAEVGWLTPEQWGVHLKRLMDDGLIDVRVYLQEKGSELIL